MLWFSVWRKRRNCPMRLKINSQGEPRRESPRANGMGCLEKRTYQERGVDRCAACLWSEREGTEKVKGEWGRHQVGVGWRSHTGWGWLFKEAWPSRLGDKGWLASLCLQMEHTSACRNVDEKNPVTTETEDTKRGQLQGCGSWESRLQDPRGRD